MEYQAAPKEIPQEIRGLTLLELLVCLFILSILLHSTAPSLGELVTRKRSEVSARQLELAIELARNAAVTRNLTVTLCRSDNGEDCGGAWHDGVLIFTDQNENRELDEEDSIVRYLMFYDYDGTITWRAFQNRQYLQITALGFTKYQNGNFTFCPRNKDTRFAQQLIINRTARVRHAQDKDGDGIREDSRGRPIRCS